MFSFAPPLRKIQVIEFNSKFKSYVRGFDFVIDVDFKGDFKETYTQTNDVVELFEELKLPYYIKFSGNGFHIIIPHKFIPLSNTGGILSTYSKTAEMLKDLLDASLVDANEYDESGDLVRTGIYDERRVIKSNYSLDVTTGKMCIPVSLSDFKIFHYDMVDPVKFLSGNIINRGLLLNNENTGKSFGDLINYLKEE